MIAEVGGIVNVSGSRIATPFAPPSPGSTPMITPRTTPMNISIRLNGVRATPNPWMSEPISANAAPFSSGSWAGRAQSSPSQDSSGPFGRGSLNHTSNSRKNTRLTPTATAAVVIQG